MFRLNEPIVNPEKRVGNAVRMNGERYLNTWYTYEVFRSYADEDMMERAYKAKLVTRRTKRALYERARTVYYRDGMFYRFRSNKNEQHEGDMFLLEPVEGELWCKAPGYMERHGIPAANIVCEDGRPVRINVEGEWFAVNEVSWPAMEAYLRLDESYKAERYRPQRKVA